MPALHPLHLLAAATALATAGLAADHPRIVVTGFGPFAGRPVNASSLLAKAIAARHPEWKARALEIPVLWGEPGKVMAKVSAEPWDIWIAFGEGGPGALSIETKAANERGNGRDNDRQGPPEPLIKDGAPAQLTLGADAPTLARRLTELGFVTRVSSSAGRYLCEEMLFTLLLAQQQSAQRGVIFIHVPPYGSKLKTSPGEEGESVRFDEATIDRVADLVAPELVQFLTKR
jgi:pyroglutamyl-peptidase